MGFLNNYRYAVVIIGWLNRVVGAKYSFMNVETLENLQLIKESARDFAETYIRPHVMEWDEVSHFPVDLFHQMGHYGFLGVLVDRKSVV